MDEEPERPERIDPFLTESDLPFDKEAMAVQLGKDPGFIRELVDLLCQDTADMLDQIEEAFREGDIERVHRAGHRLKGSVSHFAATRATDLAWQLEVLQVCEAGESSTVSDLREEMKTLTSSLYRFLDERDAEAQQEGSL